MLPVSGAEQLNTSGAHGHAAHDLGQRRVLLVGQATALFLAISAVSLGRNRFHSSCARAFGFSFSMTVSAVQRLPAAVLAASSAEYSASAG